MGKPKWKATHLIQFSDGHHVSVMLDETVGNEEFIEGDGVAYTRAEWDSCTAADYEVVNGEWLFQGQPFAGTVRRIRGKS